MAIAGSSCWTMKLWGGPLCLLQTSRAFKRPVDNTVDLGLEWGDRCHVLLLYSTLTVKQGNSLTSWKGVLMSQLFLCDGPYILSVHPDVSSKFISS